jgi:PAP2 superfamily
VNTFSVARAEQLVGRERLRRTLSWGGPVVYLVVLTVFVLREGVPLSRDRLLMWILLGLLAFSLTNLRAWIRGVILEWLPFALVLWAYDLLRGQADTLLFSTHVQPQLRADEILFGGTAPTVWLQERLWQGSWDLHWYDYTTWVVYVSYFIATYLVAGFLWFFARGLFRRFVAMVSLLALMGFATYALFPAAPPWMASELGQLEPTTRSIGYIWNHIPIAYFNSLFERGSEYANPVAAVPSLHASYTLLIALFLWRLAPLWGRFLLAAYPPAMAFALVYTAEHYFVDILVGWAYALVAFWTVNHLADRIAGAKAPRARRLRSFARRARGDARPVYAGDGREEAAVVEDVLARTTETRVGG